jgi:hypothetical protein
MIESNKQGVLSAIDFPLGQDEMAVSMAIHQLLQEGWVWTAVTKTYIRLTRTWEVDIHSAGLRAMKLDTKQEGCKYAVISHGIGIDGKVTEIKLHCKMSPENDYTEDTKQEKCPCPKCGGIGKIWGEVYVKGRTSAMGMRGCDVCGGTGTMGDK